MDFSRVLVVDNGSGMMKAGYSGDDAPRAVFPTVVGRVKDGITLPYSKPAYIGDEAVSKREVLKLSYPIWRGSITNWDEMEKIWHHSFYNELAAAPEDHPLLLTSCPLNSKKSKEKMMEIAFETFTSQAVHIANQAVLSLYSTGRTTGVVLECGDGATFSGLVTEGNIVPQGTFRLDVGGRDLTDWMMILLTETGYSFTTVAERALIQSVKESFAFVSCQYQDDLKKSSTSFEKLYELPDGELITASSERFRFNFLFLFFFLR
ncbi:actin [Reticulomyxa filosa]|uniref:Actin n=1 Tax=Reticulomyxa filosa TaxID=46433 RepID=X6N8U0_RETFI|nr:actin [Reticulomyxa filosa]|eukprot:ETO22441.1 actin [Reticulomyxa filosa]